MTVDGFADINGTRLYYERRGRGPVMLLVHGATLDHRMWQPQVDALVARFDVITYDLRGFGRSALPDGDFKHCEDAAALLDHLRVTSAIAVGHSIGALYALELCFLRPELVAGFGSLCMSALGSPAFPDDIIAVIGTIRQAAREGHIKAAKSLWMQSPWFASVRARPDLAPLMDKMLADYSGWYWTHDTPAKNIDPPAVERLEQLHVPAVIVDGGLDHAYNHAVADVLASRIPNAKLVRLPEAGHMANLEDPAAVNRALETLAR